MTSKLVFRALAALVSISAAAQSVDLSYWSISGAQQSELQIENGIVLPTNAQLYQQVTGYGVTLKLASLPIFSADPADMPVLELGKNALAFVKENDVGIIKLIQGEAQPVALSSIIALNSDGRPSESLELVVTLRAAEMILTINDSVTIYANEPLSNGTAIVLSSGASHDWAIQTLSVTTGPEVAVASAEHDSDRNILDEHTPNRAQIERNQGPAITINTDVTGTASGDTDSSAVSRENLGENRRNTLEVFTPSSVRRGRSAAIRAAMAEVSKGERP